jgi:NaMN:DMB phosphoribosyltransferase
MTEKVALDYLTALGDRIVALDAEAIARAQARQARLTKPPGSLGRLEEIAVQIAGMTAQERPSVARRAVVVMAADHGVTQEGVSAYPAEVTAQMALNFLRGGAAINAIATNSTLMRTRNAVVTLAARSGRYHRYHSANPPSCMPMPRP